MGYITDYDGRITLSSHKISEKLKKCFKENEDLEEYFGIEGIELEETCIDVNGYGKLGEEELQKFCLFIAKFDDKSYGEIKCHGEENDDFWMVDVHRGWVIVRLGEIVFNEDGDEFKDNGVNKKLYEFTKDKKLLKEIMVEELSDGN